MSLEGKVAIITGGAQGMGKAFCHELLTRKAKVGMIDMNDAQGKATATEFTSKFGKDRALFWQCDVTNGDQMTKTFKAIQQRLGGLDIVINNAGIGNEFEGWEKAVDVNVKGTIRGTTLGLELMRKDKGGKGGVIVNVSSMAGINPNPCGPVYSATKGAINMMSLSYAANPEVVASGVRINVLCPAFVNTPMFQQLTDAKRVHVPQIAQKIQEKVGVMTMEEVAADMIELVEDPTKHGAVMMVSKATGKQYKQ